MIQAIRPNQITNKISVIESDLDVANLMFDTLNRISLAKDEIKFGNCAADSISGFGVNAIVQSKELTSMSVSHYESGIKKLEECIGNLEIIKKRTCSTAVRNIATQHLNDCRKSVVSTKLLLNQLRSSASAGKTQVRKVIRMVSKNRDSKAAFVASVS